MLRTIATDQAFRGLRRAPFATAADSCVLGYTTIIYGRNGAGKTSLSELLRIGGMPAGADGSTVTASVRQNNQNKQVRLQSPDFPYSVHVYNRLYEQESLGLFLEGRGHSEPIVKLGKRSVEAAQKILLFEEAGVRLRKWHKEVRSALVAARKSVDMREGIVKSKVIELLSPGDAGRYGTATYRIDVVRKRMHKADGSDRLTDENVAKWVAVANAFSRDAIDIVLEPEGISNLVERVYNIVARSVDAEPLEYLRAEKTREAWTEVGVSIHDEGSACLFCQNGTVSADLLAAYRAHFSDSLATLRQDLQTSKSDLLAWRESWVQLMRDLPDENSLLPVHQADYAECLLALDGAVRNAITATVSVESVIDKRAGDPLEPIAYASPGFHVETSSALQALNHVITAHNEDCATQDKAKRAAQDKIEAHVAASEVLAYKEDGARIMKAERCNLALIKALGSNDAALQAVKNSQQDTTIMANRIDATLQQYFDHDHLSVSVSKDGKGYVVMRSGHVATALSEGESNSIALCYFLEGLDAEGVRPESSIVVIDDPVSSMDRESLFAAFALLDAKISGVMQSIIFTHDYELFRLLLRNKQTSYTKSQKKISEGDAMETAAPAVSVLEMVSMRPGAGAREGSLRPMSRQLLSHASEYHYLFKKVVSAVASDQSDELPLLGNAGRRLLEGFLSFKAPSAPDFQAKVNAVVKASEVDSIVATRVVKFAHAHSHRDDPSPASGLDFPSIELELEALMAFMQAADGAHFSSMCAAVGVVEPEFDFKPTRL
ncbi:AAA family ATPase [Clavibacter michiganensis]|uniref:AAA family ATPase n=1 Tax=Clavibacter michiganensis TaxID=28447 RepID=UPI00292D6B32|nr:AAA family ATPase [Clavibacter michiganensis]